jgi:hypothetical protein
MARQRKGRGRPSSIDLIPEDLRVRLNQALRDRRFTQHQILDQINELLVDRGKPEVSRSALNRYSMQIESKGAQMREARAAAEALCSGLDARGNGDLTQAVSELVRTLAFDHLLTMQEGDGVDVDVLNKVALLTQRIELASTRGIQREQLIRDEARKQALEDAAKAVEDAAVQQGLSSEQADFWRKQVLGVE